MIQKLISPLLIILLTIFLSLFIINRDFWYDESFSGGLLFFSFKDYINAILNDVHPPLYYFLLKIWSLILGTDYFSLRIFSLLPHLISIIVVYFLVKENYKETALPITLFFAISPFFLGYATETRMYSLFSCLILLSIYFFQKNFFKNTRKINFNYELYLSSIFLSFAYLTHYFSAFLVIIYFYFIINKFKLNSLKFLIKFFTIPFITFLIWLPFLINQITNSLGNVSWIQNVNIETIVNSINIVFFGIKQGIMGNLSLNNIIFLNELLLLLIFIGFIFLVGKNFDEIKNNEKNKFFLSLIILPILSIFILSIYTDLNLYIDRYFLPFFFFILFFSIIFLKKTYHRFTFYIILSIYLFQILHFYLSYKPIKEIKNITEYIKKTEYNKIIFTDPFSYTNGNYYLKNKNTYLYNINNQNENFDKWTIINKKKVITNLDMLDRKSKNIIISKFEINNKYFKLISKNNEHFFYETVK
jgi:uncharacterized membrane protein